jgi:hypothetical protein
MIRSIKKIFNAVAGDLQLVPDCPYCAAMRFALISATLTGCIFGVGLLRFWVYASLGFFIGLIQVIFLYMEFHITHDGGEKE